MNKFVLPEEKEVILEDNLNNIKVVAGPGSGKTTLIVEKIKRLVDKGIKPNKILVITYTNKSADDLERKIQERMPEHKGFYISTIHGFCTRFIRENSDFFQEYREFAILDDLDQFLFLIKNNYYIKTDELPFMKNLILDLKNYFGRIKDNFSNDEFKQIEHPLKQAYLNYCSRLIDEKKMDFGDLINITIRKIEQNSELRKIVKNKFSYLFIDEYQDVNKMQERLIKLFHSKNNKIMVVGDVNQSIYGFRGADINIFNNFEKSFNIYHNVKEYKLRINFRSTENIITISNNFLNLSQEKQIIGNQDKSVGDITKRGIKPKLFIYDDEKQEAEEIIKYIKELRDSNIIKRYSDVAILFKSVKKDAKRFIAELDSNKIKYEVLGDGSLFALDYIEALLNCYEKLSQSEDIENLLLGIQIKKDSELYKKLLFSKPLSALFLFLDASSFIVDAIKNNDDIILCNVAKLSEIIAKHQKTFSSNDFKLFISGLKNLNNSFLDTEQLAHQNVDSVKILTIHKSKGLEYPVIIIPGLNKDKYRLTNNDKISELFPEYDEAEDAKRLFYVAMTRAMELLILSYFKNKIDYIDVLQKPSLLYTKKFGHGIGLNGFLSNQEDELNQLKTLKSKKEILNTSYYKLIEYWKCRFSYKLRFFYNLFIPYKEELGRGSIIHTLLYYINLSLKENPNLSRSQIISKIPVKYKEVVKKEDQRLILYLDKLKEELKRIVNPEVPFHFSRDNLIINGRIDLLISNNDGSYTIVEFKSGKYKKSFFKRNKQNLQNAKRQIELYALSIKDEYNVSKGIVFFFGDGYKETFNVNLESAEENLNITLQEITNFNFEPCTDKDICRACVFSQYKLCPHNRYFGSYQESSDDSEKDYIDEINNNLL